MIKMISKRVVPLVAVVALVLNLAVAPQRARAVGLTATAIAAASAAAILTACGVSYWASTQTDAINYISGKLEDYLTSIEVAETPAEWLEISASSQPFTVITGGVMQFTSSIANKLLGFARWFQTEEGLESGGEAVGDLRQIVTSTNEYVAAGSLWEYSISGDTITINFDNWKTTNSRYEATLEMRFLFEPTGTSTINFNRGSTFMSATLYVYDSIDGSFINGTSLPNRSDFDFTNLIAGYDYIGLDVSSSSTSAVNGSVSFTINGGQISKDTAVITPSEFVNIPADIDTGETFALTPSVSLASGDSVDTAAETILDGITSEDGLSSTVEDTPDTAWGWLYTLLSNIASTIGAGVSDIKDKLDGVKGSADDAATAAQGAATASQGAATAAQGAASAAQDAATAAQGVETAVEGLQSTAEGIEDNTATIARNLAPATYGDVADYQLDLTSLFPFCIPRDIYTAISLFASEPEAPSIDWDMPLPNGNTYHIHYDLSQWDNIASLLRHLELLLYGVGLMMATKSIIKW